MTSAEQEHVIDICLFFYPNRPKPQVVTDDLADLAARMLFEALQASKALDLVPRPPGFIPGAGWLLSQAVQIAWRRAGKQRIYQIARNQVALNFVSEYDITRMGI